MPCTALFSYTYIYKTRYTHKCRAKLRLNCILYIAVNLFLIYLADAVKNIKTFSTSNRFLINYHRIKIYYLYFILLKQQHN